MTIRFPLCSRVVVRMGTVVRGTQNGGYTWAVIDTPTLLKVSKRN